MKHFLFLLCISLSFGQQKADWFLSNKSRIDLIPEDIREIIINELNTMEKDYNSDVKQFWLKMNTSVFAGTQFDQDGYTNQVINMRNPNQVEVEVVRSLHTRNVYKTESVDRFYSVKKIIKTKTPAWSEVLKHYGGYAATAKKGIKKADTVDFKLTHTLEKLTIMGDKTAQADIVISGDKKALDFYGIDKTELQIEGQYTYPKVTFVDIYKMGKYGNEEKTTYQGPQVTFTFGGILKNEKIAQNLYETSDSKEGKYYVKYAIPLKEIMVTMINDMVPDQVYNSQPHMVEKAKYEEDKIKAANELKNAYDETIAEYLAWVCENYSKLRLKNEGYSTYIYPTTLLDYDTRFSRLSTKCFLIREGEATLEETFYSDGSFGQRLIAKMKRYPIEELKLMVEKDMDVINRVNKAQRQEEEQKALEPLKIEARQRGITPEILMEIQANPEQTLCDDYESMINENFEGSTKKFEQAFKKAFKRQKFNPFQITEEQVYMWLLSGNTDYDPFQINEQEAENKPMWLFIFKHAFVVNPEWLEASQQSRGFKKKLNIIKKAVANCN